MDIKTNYIPLQKSVIKVQSLYAEYMFPAFDNHGSFAKSTSSKFSIIEPLLLLLLLFYV